MEGGGGGGGRGGANNTGADQPAYPHSLISTFVIRFLENIICKLASLCSCKGWFKTRFVGNPKDRFSHDGAHVSLASSTYQELH